MAFYNKHNVVATRFKKGSYNIQLKMKNQNFCLYSLVDFKTLPFIGQLNKNLFKNVEVETVNNTSSKMLFVFHDFFKIFHIKQKYISLQGDKIENLEKTKKKFVISNLERNDSLEQQNMDQLKIEKVRFEVSKIAEKEKEGEGEEEVEEICFVDCDLAFQIPFPLPSFVEKIAVRLCLRFVVFTKQYFENIKELV